MKTITGDPSGNNGSVELWPRSGGQPAVGQFVAPRSQPASFSYNADDEISRRNVRLPTATRQQTGGKTFAYNSENQLISMNGSGGDHASTTAMATVSPKPSTE